MYVFMNVCMYVCIYTFLSVITYDPVHCCIWHYLGSQNVIAYSTAHGYLVGWDLRSPTVAWHLQNEAKHGQYSILFIVFYL